MAAKGTPWSLTRDKRIKDAMSKWDTPPTEQSTTPKPFPDASQKAKSSFAGAWKRNMTDTNPRIGQTYMETLQGGRKVHLYKSGEKVVLAKKKNPRRYFL